MGRLRDGRRCGGSARQAARPDGSNSAGGSTRTGAGGRDGRGRRDADKRSAR